MKRTWDRIGEFIYVGGHRKKNFAANLYSVLISKKKNFGPNTHILRPMKRNFGENPYILMNRKRTSAISHIFCSVVKRTSARIFCCAS